MNVKLLFFLLFPVFGIGQVQIGQDIDGGPGDLSGSHVSLSSDGNIVAIGAPDGDVYGIVSGLVRVYGNISGVWTQIGQLISGKAYGDKFGHSISLSADGNIVAIGAPSNSYAGYGYVSVYKNISGVWTQIGQDIIGNDFGVKKGFSVSLSADGNIVAIGAPSNSYAGYVSVYKNISGVWTQIGQIYRKYVHEGFGHSVSLSSDGGIVAIGTFNGGNLVRVYENTSGTWTQMGGDILGAVFYGNVFGSIEEPGYRVSLSADGQTLAIGAFRRGRVRVFRYHSVSGILNWQQIGQDIYGGTNEISRTSVSLSADGNTLVIGSPYNNGNGVDSGGAQIYKNISGIWTQIGQDIDGEAAEDQSGYSVSLSSDGNTVAIGAPHNSGNGNSSGHVRIYDLTAVGIDKFVLDNFNVYPNPVTDVLNIRLENNLILQKVALYNNLGQMVKESNQETIDVSGLAKGLYFVEVETNQGKASKKVIIK